MRAYQVIRCLEELAPLKLAEEWDNSGWQVGDPEEEVSAVLFTLDLTPGVLKQAVEQEANLIISHHPLIFRPIPRLRIDQFPGNYLQELIKCGLMLYSAHTSLDKAPQGISQVLAETIGLQDIRVLDGRQRRQLFKLAVFVPETHLEEVREAVCRAGAGWIGRYSDCTFRSPGTGTFRPLEGSSPFLGQQGILEEAAEYRLETVVPEELLSGVIQAMLQAHPYEEVAYDLYALANDDRAYSPARIGRLPEKSGLVEIAGLIKRSLKVDYLKAAFPANDLLVERVAVCGGSGAEFISAAAREGAQLLVTGDLKYHEAQEAKRLGLAVIAAGHAASEQPGLTAAAGWLSQRLKEEYGNRGVKIPRIITNNQLEDEINII